MKIEQRVSAKDVFEIARCVDVEGKKGDITVEEQLATYKVYIEIPPSRASLNDCKAVQITVDIQDGRILKSMPAACQHHHNCV